jgi:adenine-specific DNA-methyltransferase
MVSRAVTSVPGSFEKSATFTVLDPACGDGAFILPVLDEILRRASAGGRSATRLEIVRDHVFGVDADSAAVEAVRRRVTEWIGSGDASLIQGLVNRNFRHGDALVGNDWSPCELSEPTDSPDGAPPIDWKAIFPEVAVAGGFDLVIGNPPYRREKNAKSDFDRIAQSALGQRWRTARMDLWHYFLHRGLDLLKPGGRLAFIVNSYWTRSTAARPLRERVQAETTLELIVFLGAAPLFQDVSGRHMIFQTVKQRSPQSICAIVDMSHQNRDQIEAEFAREDPGAARLTLAPAADVWSADCLRIPSKNGSDRDSGKTLDECFEVRQGIAENPPFVTRAAAIELGDPALAGRGVFVLTNDEVAGLDLSEPERALLRPYYSLASIDRYHVAAEPSHWILYLTRQTAASLEMFPRVAAHLERFRPILERRREALSGKIAWWHLHWPRQQRLFVEPRILCLQMGNVPRFAWSDLPTFVGFSMHVISAGQATSGSLTLPALVGILNSSLARDWFESHAKRRGVNLDISGTVLKQFPLPGATCPDIERELDLRVRNWSELAKLDREAGSTADRQMEFELRVNELVEDLYASAGA